MRYFLARKAIRTSTPWRAFALRENREGLPLLPEFAGSARAKKNVFNKIFGKADQHK
jgi:hypothetical protein